jgi:hypothetical protein
MASGLTRNQMPGNRLRVRIPCPPLELRRLVSVSNVENVANLLPMNPGPPETGTLSSQIPRSGESVAFLARNSD